MGSPALSKLQAKFGMMTSLANPVILHLRRYLTSKLPWIPTNGVLTGTSTLLDRVRWGFMPQRLPTSFKHRLVTQAMSWLSGGSRAVGKAPVSGPESRLPDLCPVLEFLLQPSASRLPNRVWSVSDNCCPPFFSPFLRVWLVLCMLLGEMNTSNEDSNPQNKTTSNLQTNQEKHQKRAEGSGQGLY